MESHYHVENGNAYHADLHSRLYDVGPSASTIYRPATPDMDADVTTLAQLLKPVTLYDTDSVAGRLFGADLRHQKLSVDHALNLWKERKTLHDRHMREMGRRHWDLQGQLFGAQLHAHVDGHRRFQRLQQQLLQLDEVRRKEERDFWQDTVELRKVLFDAGKEYQALGSRASWFQDIERGGGAHD